MTGRAGFSPSGSGEIRYFERAESAPPFRQIDIVECDGFAKLFHMPTYEKALEEAKVQARKKGGDCVVLYKAVKATELGGGFDITTAASQLLLKEKTSEKVDKYLSENTAEDQIVWFFLIGKLEKAP